MMGNHTELITTLTMEEATDIIEGAEVIESKDSSIHKIKHPNHGEATLIFTLDSERCYLVR